MCQFAIMGKRKRAAILAALLSSVRNSYYLMPNLLMTGRPYNGAKHNHQVL